MYRDLYSVYSEENSVVVSQSYFTDFVTQSKCKHPIVEGCGKLWMKQTIVFNLILSMHKISIHY